MSGFEVGDFVLVLAKVVKVYGSDIGYSVELFSKTDQYTAMVRPDLVIAKMEAREPRASARGDPQGHRRASLDVGCAAGCVELQDRSPGRRPDVGDARLDARSDPGLRVER